MKNSEQKIEQLQKELKELEQQMQKPSFWQNKEKSKQAQKQYMVLKKNLAKIQKHNKGSAILSIQAGAGGRDAEDWAVLLLRMYQKYCERKNWSCKILSQTFAEGGGPEGRIGIRDVSMEIGGKFAYGFLEKETGVHRLVRISPFSAKKLRHTSFAKVEVLPSIKDTDTEEIKIKPEDLKIETFRASGHGGQNVNKRETAVRLTHLPTGFQASCQAERLQIQNRKIATQILLGKLIRQEEEKRELELEKVKGKNVSADFGHQIRSYVLHPYKLVKDHRTGVATSDVEGVLDGNLAAFIDAEIQL